MLVSLSSVNTIVILTHQPKNILCVIGLVARLNQRSSPWTFKSPHLKDVSNDILVTDHDSFLVSRSA